METKICTKCKEVKKLDQFNKNRTRIDGLCIHCKSCIKLNTSKYYIKNKEKILKYSKEYSIENKRYDYKKQWYEDNKDILKEKERTYRVNRYNNDYLFKLKSTVGNNIRNNLNKNNYIKSDKTLNILGCNIELYKTYLESRFENWMNWDNYGKYNGEFNYGWDIDHITPSSSAKTEEELLKLLYYLNTQPLCSKINREIKKDKL